MIIKWESFKEKLWGLVPYSATLFYIEIIYMMFMAGFLYGKVAAVVSGVMLSILLTFQVIALFGRINISRKIQLFIMDVHLAYSVAFIFNRLLSDFPLSAGDIAMSVFRGGAAVIELPMIILLTDEFIIRRYR